MVAAAALESAACIQAYEVPPEPKSTHRHGCFCVRWTAGVLNLSPLDQHVDQRIGLGVPRRYELLCVSWSSGQRIPCSRKWISRKMTCSVLQMARAVQNAHSAPPNARTGPRAL